MSAKPYVNRGGPTTSPSLGIMSNRSAEHGRAPRAVLRTGHHHIDLERWHAMDPVLPVDFSHMRGLSNVSEKDSACAHGKEPLLSWTAGTHLFGLQLHAPALVLVVSVAQIANLDHGRYIYLPRQ